MSKKVFIVSLLMLFLSVLVLSSQVLATSLNDEEVPPKPTIGIPAEDLQNGYSLAPSFNIDIIEQNSNQYLDFGNSFIFKLSSTSVQLSGMTSAKSAVNTVGVQMYLERWNASNQVWETIANAGNNTNTSSNSVSHTRNVNVARNYYYRTRSVHWINHAGIYEQTTTFSQYILID